MRKIISSIIGLFLCVIILSSCSNDSNKNDIKEDLKENKEITIGVTPWSSTKPPTQIAKILLEDLGYEVNTVEADVGPIFLGLAKGDIDVFMDSWLPDLHRNFIEKYKDELDDTAISYKDAKIGWVVPTYMKDINSIEDLVSNEDIVDKKIYGIEAGAGITKTSYKMIEDYGLDIEYIESSEAAMLAKASKSIKKKEPIVFVGWRPHPMFIKYDLKVLDNDKGFFSSSDVHVLTNKDFKNKNKEAYEILQRWSIDIEDIEKMIVEIDENDKDVNDVAKTWIENHQDKVAEFLGNETK